MAKLGDKTLRVWVSKADIASGVRRNCFDCPVTLAVRKVFTDNIRTVSIYGGECHIHGQKKSYAYKLSNRTCGKINDYDLGGEMKPGYVDLTLKEVYW